MTVLREYHEALGASIIKYSGTLERYAGDGVMVVFNDPVPVENPALQAVLMALEMRDAIGALTETWRRWGHDIGSASGLRTASPRSAPSASRDASIMRPSGRSIQCCPRLCDEAKPGQILISPRVLTKVENTVKVETVGEFELKGIRRPLAAYNVVAASPSKVLKRTARQRKGTVKRLQLLAHRPLNMMRGLRPTHIGRVPPARKSSRGGAKASTTRCP